ncbi:hypothetical protein MYAM1_003486 [Malassezia yamatoensis]|uniref:J domain-containing protein n=1 Tax=Malassezia yamatoensis TaxID=253288 RepID=A0AAJ5YWS9_9BASI|nr:hypothetical protein MYAM1_003486 [Malassezia yamatoensis]
MRSVLRLAYVVALVYTVAVVPNLGHVAAEDVHTVSDWLKQANGLLASSDYVGALEAFDHAIAQDSEAYLTYFRRATAQQALGRTGAALDDLEATLKRNPSFGKAYLQAARIHYKEGEYTDALSQLKQHAKHSKTDQSDAEELQSQIQHAYDLSKRLKKLTHARNKHTECVKVATELVKLAPNDLDARRSRAACYLASGDWEDAVTDWNRVAILAPNPLLQRRLSFLSFYILGSYDSQQQKAGLNYLKACLHNDPDNKLCSRAHKTLRRIQKALTKAHKFADSESWTAVTSALKGPKVGGPTIWDEVQSAIQAAQQPEEDGQPLLPKEIHDPMEKSRLVLDMSDLYCRAYGGQKLYKKAMPYCEKLLKHDPNNIPAAIVQGEEHMANHQYEDAARIFSHAFAESGQQNRDLYQRMAKAQKLLKQSKAKDYYKILNVARDADEKTIKKAYRRLAREHHPDKGGSQEKMAEINEAFGVLGDAQLRARYDQGDDPNDPTGGQQADPFQGGFGQAEAFQQMFQNGGFQQFARQHGHAFQGGGSQFHFSF